MAGNRERNEVLSDGYDKKEKIKLTVFIFHDFQYLILKNIVLKSNVINILKELLRHLGKYSSF